MKPANFDYVRPLELSAAVEALGSASGEGKVLAGGQSLIPAMNFRLARPGLLVDITRIDELKHITATDGVVSIGAGVTQRQAERDASLRSKCSGVAEALRYVGHVQNRSRGTVCGSIAHADPAAELPALALALGAELNVRGPSGSKRVPIDGFFQGPFSTTLDDDDLLVSVDLPVDDPSTIVIVDEMARRSGDFALAGVVVRLDLADGEAFRKVRVVAFGVSSTPLRLPAVEALLESAHPTEGIVAEASETSRSELVDATVDSQADAAYRRDVVAALIARSLSTAIDGNRSGRAM